MAHARIIIYCDTATFDGTGVGLLFHVRRYV